jgi:predicted dehydrogenase
MDKVKVAVIGCGRIGSSQHIPAYSKNPLTEIKYLVDIKPERAIELAGKYAVKNAITDFRGPYRHCLPGSR